MLHKNALFDLFFNNLTMDMPSSFDHFFHSYYVEAEESLIQQFKNAQLYGTLPKRWFDDPCDVVEEALEFIINFHNELDVVDDETGEVLMEINFDEYDGDYISFSQFENVDFYLF